MSFILFLKYKLYFEYFIISILYFCIFKFCINICSTMINLSERYLQIFVLTFFNVKLTFLFLNIILINYTQILNWNKMWLFFIVYKSCHNILTDNDGVNRRKQIHLNVCWYNTIFYFIFFFFFTLLIYKELYFTLKLWLEQFQSKGKCSEYIIIHRTIRRIYEYFKIRRENAFARNFFEK